MIILFIRYIIYVLNIFILINRPFIKFIIQWAKTKNRKGNTRHKLSVTI
jgi:hypothetical protein